MSSIPDSNYWCKVAAVQSYKIANNDKKPRELLQDISNDEILLDIESGDIDNLKSKYKEGTHTKGEKAMELVQKALIYLDLLKIISSCESFNWGIYGDQTIAAIRGLQESAGIFSDGQLFGKQTLAALKTALDAKIKGKDWRFALKQAKHPEKKGTPDFTFEKLLRGSN